LREEEFLIQFWLKVNPSNEATVDSHIVLELLKLIYDPYIPPIAHEAKNAAHLHQESLVKEYLNAIRRLNNLEPLPMDVDDVGTEMLWSVADTLKALRFLTDNFGSFKSGGSSTGIKVPSQKQRQTYHEASKECTFTPAVCKRSKLLEKHHWASFFLQ